MVLSALRLSPGHRVLDIGCGDGAFRAPVEAAGAVWQGVDPAAPTNSHAVRGVAEALDFPDDGFDAAVILNALHHVPVPAMDAALAEAARILMPGGRLVVMEPDAEGALSQVLAVIDDETAIRQAAQQALDRAGADRVLHAESATRFTRTEPYADFDAFCASLVAVDPARAALIDTHRAALQARFDALARDQNGTSTLSQPMLLRVMRAPVPEVS